MAIEPKGPDMLNRNESGSVKNGVYSETIAALRFLVLGEVSEREIPKRGDREAMTIYQQAVAIIGGPRQQNFTMGNMDKENVLQEGCYMLSNDVLRVGDYDRLELTKRPTYVYLRPLTDGERKLFQSAATSLADLS